MRNMLLKLKRAARNHKERSAAKPQPNSNQL
jgi:hypothetical protein